MRGSLLWLAGLLLVALSGALAQPQVHLLSTTAPPDYWDPRLNGLNVALVPATNCSQGCWRLTSAIFEDVDESGGLHHIFARAFNADGSQRGGESWTVAWPGGSQALVTQSDNWADMPMFGPGGCYDHTAGPGPFEVRMGADYSRSDRVTGIGLPQCQHVNFRLTWQWRTDAPPTATPPPPTATAPPATSTPPPAPTHAPPTPRPLPGTEAVARIGPSGGALQYWRDEVVITIIVEEGALTTPAWLTLSRVNVSTLPDYFAVGSTWMWTLHDDLDRPAHLSRPLTIEQSVRYTDLPGDARDTMLYGWDQGDWRPLDDGQNTVVHAAASAVNQGVFAILYPADKHLLPLFAR